MQTTAVNYIIWPPEARQTRGQCKPSRMPEFIDGAEHTFVLASQILYRPVRTIEI